LCITNRLNAGSYRGDVINVQCIPGGRDYVEVLGGSGLDTSTMTRFVAMCGLQAQRGT